MTLFELSATLSLDTSEFHQKADQAMQKARELSDTLGKASWSLPGVKEDGSHAGGLRYVPKDDYIARLHEGEAVLTKSEATAWRRGEGQGVSLDVQGLAEALGEVISDRPVAISIDGKAFATIMAKEMSRSIGSRNIQTLMGMGG